MAMGGGIVSSGGNSVDRSAVVSPEVSACVPSGGGGGGMSTDGDSGRSGRCSSVGVMIRAATDEAGVGFN